LSTRTALAAFIAATISLLIVGAVVRNRFTAVLQDRVDDQLEGRADTAPVLAAVADRLSRSELSATVEGARVGLDGEIVELGQLPHDPLPDVLTPGFSTVSADGERWRLYTIEVRDVPDVGDRTLVELSAPLGDADAQARALRRRAALIGLITALAAGAVGWALGVVAASPLTRLRRDSLALGGDDPTTWSVATEYGSPEADDVAAALNASLRRVADETMRRAEALDAARSFAASASHELRTPLQSALMNLDIARSERATADDRSVAVGHAHEQVERMASSLAAVRALADAEFADRSWFEPLVLAEVVDVAIADERRRDPGAQVELAVSSERPVEGWRDGVRLAVGNVVRNALVHGGGRVAVRVDGGTVTVDDDGPGIAPDERAAVVQRFHRGAGSSGSGLGLTIAAEVAAAHGGTIAIDTSPLGGARVTLTFEPPSFEPASFEPKSFEPPTPV
jgi:two-component system sensor histidine kinase PrrB